MGPPRRWNLSPPVTSQPAPKRQYSVFPSLALPPLPPWRMPIFFVNPWHIAEQFSSFVSQSEIISAADYFPMSRHSAHPRTWATQGRTLGTLSTFLVNRFSSLGQLLVACLFSFKLHGKEGRKKRFPLRATWFGEECRHRGRALWEAWTPPDELSFSPFGGHV